MPPTWTWNWASDLRRISAPDASASIIRSPVPLCLITDSFPVWYIFRSSESPTDILLLLLPPSGTLIPCLAVIIPTESTFVTSS